MKVKLVCVDVVAPHGNIRIPSLPAVLCRNPEAEIRVDDSWASHCHCEIVEIDGSLIVRDLGSTHGTFVNGSQVTESPLMPGDKLTIGMSNFDVRFRQGSLNPLSALWRSDRRAGENAST